MTGRPISREYDGSKIGQEHTRHYHGEVARCAVALLCFFTFAQPVLKTEDNGRPTEVSAPFDCVRMHRTDDVDQCALSRLRPRLAKRGGWRDGGGRNYHPM